MQKLPFISFEDVAFTYDGTSFVLDGVNLSIEQGEFVAILGGNGSGKSTLAKHIDALLTPDSGRVLIDSNDTADPSCTYLIRSIAGMVFQNPDDQIVASIVENDVAFGPENLGVDQSELRNRVTKALELVDLQGYEKNETSALSGGQKQRIALAGVLAMEPRVLVLDEASSMLDPRGRHGLMKTCRALHEAGMTIIMITHFMDEAVEADRIVVMADGHPLMQGSPADVLSRDSELAHLSLEAPFAVKLCRALQARGIELATSVDEDEIIAHLAALAHKSAAVHD